MKRRRQLQSINGYAVIAVPDSGLFVKDGRIVCGHGKDMESGELILFTRRADAVIHARQRADEWIVGDKTGHSWSFPVIPVLVHERV